MTFIAIGLLFLHALSAISAQNVNYQTGQCPTSNRVPGRCIGIRQCPDLLKLLQSRPLKTENIEFLRRSQCGFEGRDPKVCCPLSNVNIEVRPGGSDTSDNNGNSAGTQRPGTDRNPAQIDLSNNPLLPTDCGRDLSQRILGGERTDLDEFPWMALLEYTKPIGRTTACGGVLISKRYVLTAAHCVNRKSLPASWTLTGVRLGEYDTETDRDCIEDGDGTRVCADDPITVGIEEHIPHEEYGPDSPNQRNDIALLRLSRDVRFTNFIKPICLPANSSFGQKLYVAGWGRTENRSESNVKLKLALPLVDLSECSRTYSNAGKRLGLGQFCAGGQKGKDSCKGDSGGPLMSVERTKNGMGRWTAVGVVSFGPLPCGMQGWPGVYTKVSDYIPWILSKLRA